MHQQSFALLTGGAADTWVGLGCPCLRCRTYLRRPLNMFVQGLSSKRVCQVPTQQTMHVMHHQHAQAVAHDPDLHDLIQKAKTTALMNCSLHSHVPKLSAQG